MVDDGLSAGGLQFGEVPESPGGADRKHTRGQRGLHVHGRIAQIAAVLRIDIQLCEQFLHAGRIALKGECLTSL